MIVEAAWVGYSVSTMESFKRTNTIVALIDPKKDISDGVKWSDAELGARYFHAGLIGMAWVMICRHFGAKIRNPFRSSKSLFCSEAVTLTLQHAGYPGSGELDANSTSPEDLYEFLTK